MTADELEERAFWRDMLTHQIAERYLRQLSASWGHRTFRARALLVMADAMRQTRASALAFKASERRR